MGVTFEKKRKIFHIEVTEIMMTSIGIAYMQIIKRLVLLQMYS